MLLAWKDLELFVDVSFQWQMIDCSEENGETQSLLYGLNDIKVHFDLTGTKELAHFQK